MLVKTLKTLLPILVVTSACLVAAGPAPPQVTRHKINAKGEGAFTSPTTTESQIIGGGILHGTTTAELVITGIEPTSGALTYEGILILTTEQGTFTLAILDGLFDQAAGEFSNAGAVTNGTGRFERATGELSFHGFVAPDETFIDDAIVGEICVDLP